MISTETVVDDRETLSFHPATRVGARIISYLFHPLFLPIYAILFLIYEIRVFPEKNDWERKLVVIQYLVSYTVLPLMTILLMKGLGFVGSIELKTQRDRILPYVACEIFYFWTWYVARNLHYPKVVVLFSLGVFLACSFGLVLNSYMKVSMHGIAVGTLCAFLLLAGTMVHLQFGIYIAIGFLVAGLTATARLIDSDHHRVEVYTGFFAGALVQVIAYWFV